MKKGIWLPILLGVATLALAVAAFFLLPDTVVTQFSVGGSGVTTMPKLIAILVPTAIGMGGAVAAICMREQQSSRSKSLIVSAVGVAVFLFMLFVNR